MNNTTLYTNNKRQSRIERFKEFCSLPLFRIAELTLGMFSIANRWFEVVFGGLFENPIIDWMSKIRHNFPIVFWISSVLWIPIAIIFYFDAIDLLIISALFTAVAIIGSAIVIAVVCKICHFIFIIRERPSQNEKNTQ